jgi:hypothetical protein
MITRPHKAVIQEWGVGIAPHDRGVEVAEWAADNVARILLYMWLRNNPTLPPLRGRIFLDSVPGVKTPGLEFGHFVLRGTAP